MGQTPDEAVFNSAIETLSEKLDVYDKILSKQKYLAGDVCPALIVLSCRL